LRLAGDPRGRDRPKVLESPYGRRSLIPRRDLSLDEQPNVRAYLQMLRVRFGNWHAVERALPVSHSVMNDIRKERVEVSVAIACRIAQMLGVSLHHVLTGTTGPTCSFVPMASRDPLG
jgi:hypothetical protein